jgi:hypothetical protein
VAEAGPPAEQERAEAARLFNVVWELMERERTAAEDLAMVHAAHASRHHWTAAGGPVNWARGEWQVSRVYSLLGRVEAALWHGRACLALVEEHELGAFDRGYAHEALARAHSLAGRLGATRRHLVEAKRAALQVPEGDDRALLEADLATVEV